LEYRFLYIEQIARALGESTRGVELRLKLLYHNGYVDRIKLPVDRSNKMIYSLREKGAKLLAEAEGIGRDEIAWTRFHNQVTPTHISHLLTINDALISYELALAEAQKQGAVEGYKIDRGEPNRNRISVQLQDNVGKRTRAAVVPDAILRIVFPRNQQSLFFLEVDRGTMTKRRWQEKMAVYKAFQESPKLQERFKTHSFIVLTVAPSERRIASLAEATVALGGRRGFWYTTMDQLLPDLVLGKIWVKASDLYELRKEEVSKLSVSKEATRSELADSVR